MVKFSLHCPCTTFSLIHERLTVDVDIKIRRLEITCVQPRTCLEKKLKVRGSGKEKNPEMYPILGDLACCAFQEGFQEFRQ